MKPEENLEVKGVLRIRDNDGKRSTVPFRYQVIVGEKTWQSIYETQPDAPRAVEKLTVIQGEDRPNRYVLVRLHGADVPAAGPRALDGDQATSGLNFCIGPNNGLLKKRKSGCARAVPAKCSRA